MYQPTPIVRDFQKELDNFKLESTCLNQDRICAFFDSAIVFGNPLIVTYLIEQGADINMRLSRADSIDLFRAGKTPLMLAVMHDQFDIFKVLLAQNPELNKTDYYGKDALLIAIERSQYFDSSRYIELLFEHGVQLDTVYNLHTTDFQPYQATPLIKATRHDAYGHIIRFLLQHGANPNQGISNHNHWLTALGLALSNSNIQTAQCLLQYGADPNQPSAMGLINETYPEFASQIKFPLQIPDKDYHIRSLLTFYGANDVKMCEKTVFTQRCLELAQHRLFNPRKSKVSFMIDMAKKADYSKIFGESAIKKDGFITVDYHLIDKKTMAYLDIHARQIHFQKPEFKERFRAALLAHGIIGIDCSSSELLFVYRHNQIKLIQELHHASLNPSISKFSFFNLDPTTTPIPQSLTPQ